MNGKYGFSSALLILHFKLFHFVLHYSYFWFVRNGFHDDDNDLLATKGRDFEYFHQWHILLL